MGPGIVTEPTSLYDRVRRAQPTSSMYDTGEPVDAGRQIDTGGLSAAGFGPSPVAQGGYGQSSQHPGAQATRLVQRINPSRNRHQMAEEYQGG